MLTVTPLYLGVFALGAVALGSRVVHLRRRDGVGIGHGESRDLRRAIRTHGNYVEWVPLILLGLVVLELQGAGDLLLHGLGGTLILARLLHAFGLSRHHGVSPGRFIGASLSFGILAIVGSLLIFEALP
jgi:uncharacterized membrane protein YecN with MAPEG domain